MNFVNQQFGEMTFEENLIIQFPKGIVGFESLRKFLIVNDEATDPFRWLVSVEDSAVSFPLIPSAYLLQQYDVPVPADGAVFLVALLSDKVEQSTVNLRAPIIIDNAAGTGRQMILQDDAYPLQHPLFPPHQAKEA